MSDDGTMGGAPTTPNEVRGDETPSYGSSKAPLRANARADQNQTDQLAVFVQEQPLTAALVALIVGYFIGKIT